MKTSFIFRTLTLFFVCGIIISEQNVFSAPIQQADKASTTVAQKAPQGLPQNAVKPAVAKPNPANGNQVFPAQPNVARIPTPTQHRTGYTRNEIRSMPLLNRPNRPGHFVGNTIRRRAGVAY